MPLQDGLRPADVNAEGHHDFASPAITDQQLIQQLESCINGSVACITARPFIQPSIPLLEHPLPELPNLDSACTEQTREMSRHVTDAFTQEVPAPPDATLWVIPPDNSTDEAGDKKEKTLPLCHGPAFSTDSSANSDVRKLCSIWGRTSNMPQMAHQMGLMPAAISYSVDEGAELAQAMPGFACGKPLQVQLLQCIVSEGGDSTLRSMLLKVQLSWRPLFDPPVQLAPIPPYAQEEWADDGSWMDDPMAQKIAAMTASCGVFSIFQGALMIPADSSQAPEVIPSLADLLQKAEAACMSWSEQCVGLPQQQAGPGSRNDVCLDVTIDDLIAKDMVAHQDPDACPLLPQLPLDQFLAQNGSPDIDLNLAEEALDRIKPSFIMPAPLHLELDLDWSLAGGLAVLESAVTPTAAAPGVAAISHPIIKPWHPARPGPVMAVPGAATLIQQQSALQHAFIAAVRVDDCRKLVSEAGKCAKLRKASGLRKPVVAMGTDKVATLSGLHRGVATAEPPAPPVPSDASASEAALQTSQLAAVKTMNKVPVTDVADVLLQTAAVEGIPEAPDGLIVDSVADNPLTEPAICTQKRPTTAGSSQVTPRKRICVSGVAAGRDSALGSDTRPTTLSSCVKVATLDPALAAIAPAAAAAAAAADKDAEVTNAACMNVLENSQAPVASDAADVHAPSSAQKSVPAKALVDAPAADIGPVIHAVDPGQDTSNASTRLQVQQSTGVTVKPSQLSQEPAVIKVQLGMRHIQLLDSIRECWEWLLLQLRGVPAEIKVVPICHT